MDRVAMRMNGCRAGVLFVFLASGGLVVGADAPLGSAAPIVSGVGTQAVDSASDELAAEQVKRTEWNAKMNAATSQIIALNDEEQAFTAKLREINESLSKLSRGDSASVTNAELVTMRERLKVLEAETTKLKTDIKARIEANPEYQSLKKAKEDGYAKLDEFREKRKAISDEKSDAAAKVWQSNRKEQLAREKAQAEADKKAGGAEGKNGVSAKSIGGATGSESVTQTK